MVRQAHHERRSEDFEKALMTLTPRLQLRRPFIYNRAVIANVERQSPNTGGVSVGTDCRGYCDRTDDANLFSKEDRHSDDDQKSKAACG